ncbi:hypothetical protein CDL12_16539 [Handroanthus impetiginosus]|uniref:BHLH domain-containing protein n=1 Tax=Handroanthus impetiginosus TaxID=429701 RepID=A0A2G9H012_9LAMI|nr:hypothetical protein CDL12_16539 [Handroanthus impetiginosus]
MEKDFRFGFHRHLDLLSPNPNLLDFPFDSGHLNTEPVFSNLHSVEDSRMRKFPSFFQQPEASEPNNSLNWFHHMSHFDPAAFAPAASNEKFPLDVSDFGQGKSPPMGTVPAQKRFLVFDQSGDKTTLIYSSGIQTPIQFGASWMPNAPTAYNVSKDEPTATIHPLRPTMNDENIGDNSRDVSEDEMREDTEELEALLCSDDNSDFSEDDEETSTGHSPSTMTDNVIRDLVEEMGEEVDSFAGPAKRQKLSDGGFDVPSMRRTPTSLKTFASSALDDDAESICGNSKESLGSWSSGKRSRKEKISETVGILQSIIPSVNGKDAIVVIDEAIRYLRSLKVKAKALGVDTL